MLCVYSCSSRSCSCVCVSCSLFSGVFQCSPAAFIAASGLTIGIGARVIGIRGGHGFTTATPRPYPAGHREGEGQRLQQQDADTHALSEPFSATPITHALRSRSRDARRPREMAIERIIREGSSSGNWPQLTRTNYSEWSLRMKLKMQHRPGGDGARACDQGNRQGSLGGHQDAPHRRRSRVEGDDAEPPRDGEAIEDFALRLTGIVQRLASLGDPEPDTKVVAKYLCIVCPRYKQLVISIETLLDISQLSIEEVTGRLKAADDVEPTPPQAAGGKLLLTEEQWLERYKKQDSGRGSSSSGGRGKRRGKPRGRGGNNSDGRGGPSSGRVGPDDVCKRCGKKGHWAQHCRGKLKTEKQAHVAQDDEPTLMFAYGAVSEGESPTLPLPPQAPLPLPNTPLRNIVELVEAKVFAAFDLTEDRDPKRWVLDIGATNHMTGSRGSFSDLDTGIVGTVRFGDGSVVKI
ncbi:uncharacterized protein [Miscanthus floridulus]|uniref:uncharacterized protein n=1 Tax=Miscanthus floridulus TaxID=154761 RepID=UPI003459A016